MSMCVCVPERKERNKEGKREHEEGNKTILKRRKGRKEGRKRCANRRF